MKLWETNSFHAWTLRRKLRAFLEKQVSQNFMYSFLGLIALGNLPFPAQGCTALCHCFRLKSGRGSKAAKRLGDFLQTEWGLSLCQSLRGEGPSPPFSIAPKSFPEALFMTMPVLGHPSIEESYPSLTNQSYTGGQAGWSKVGRGGAPAREISFVSLVAYGPKVSDSALTTGVYSFWNQAGQFPTLWPLYST